MSIFVCASVPMTGIGPLSATPEEFDGSYFAEVMGGMSVQGHNNVSG